MEDARKPTAREVMTHLGRFAEGDPEDVAGMTPEEVRAELVEAGYDLDALSERLRVKLAALRQLAAGDEVR